MIYIKESDINSLNSEAGIIASLIHKPELCFYSEYLLPNHFTNDVNKYIYHAITDLAQKGIVSIDPYMIIEDLVSLKTLPPDLTLERLNDLFDVSDTLAKSTVEEYQLLVSNVLDAAFRRDAFNVLKKCQGLCYDDSVEDIKRQISQSIDDVILEYSKNEEVVEFKDVIDDLWEDVEKHQNGEICGIPFKFPTLNEYVTLEPGELVVVAAPAKGGKSMFCLNEAVDVLKMGKSVLYIDSELSSRMFLCRLISHLTGINFHLIKNGGYSIEDKKKIDTAIEWVKNQKLVHKYMPIFNQQEIYTTTKKVMHKFEGLDLVVVDYLKPTGDPDPYATSAELGKLCDLLKNDIAGKLNIAGLAAAQLNDNGKLADSIKISRNASTVMMLLDKTPDEIDADTPECGNKKLIVKFNRNGMQHIQGEYISLFFNGNIICFKEANVSVGILLL